MPPTRAAATNTACGRLAPIQVSTALARRRSHSACVTVRISHDSAASRRTSAAPTSPRWPVTQTRLFCSAYGKFAGIVAIPALQRLAVGLDHLGNELIEARLVVPAETLARLFGVAEQQIDLGRPIVMGVDRDQAFTGARAQAALVGARARPSNRPVDAAESALDEFAHRMSLTGRQHIVFGLLLLEDEPHALDVVAGVTPIALGVDIAEKEPLLQPALDRGDCPRDLSGDEGLAAHRRLVVEQDAVRGVQAVGLAVIHRDPVGIELGHGIGAARVKRRQLALWRLHDL